jgi:hypothetical protein
MLALLAYLRPSGLFLPLLVSALLLLFSNASAALRAALLSILAAGGFFDFVPRLADLPFTSGDKSVGKWACSLNGPFDPTGRLRMTPGFDMAAAMTSGSLLSFATP